MKLLRPMSVTSLFTWVQIQSQTDTLNR